MTSLSRFTSTVPVALTLALASAHGAALADSVPEQGWNTSAELGAITTSGNTVGASVTGKIDAKQEMSDWSNEYILSGYFKDEEVTGSVDVEIGPGYFSGVRNISNGSTTAHQGDDTESGMTIRGAAAMKWQLSDSALISQTVSVERGTSNVHSLAETALRTKINSTMQMKAAFSARNDTSVPEDKKNTDTQTSVTLVYSF